MRSAMTFHLSALLALCAACSKPEPAPESSTPLAAPTAPLTAPPASTATGQASAGGLSWVAPAKFVARTPKSSMRVAEYGLQTDPTSELGVFYFGADQGGSVDANMTRWVGQFRHADGSETQAKRSKRNVNGIDVELVEAQGTYSGGMAMPGGPAPSAQNDAMLLGAIAKGPQGSVFFKLVGSQAGLEGARGDFDHLLESLH
jgi:hypothetical protein